MQRGKVEERALTATRIRQPGGDVNGQAKLCARTAG